MGHQISQESFSRQLLLSILYSHPKLFYPLPSTISPYNMILQKQLVYYVCIKKSNAKEEVGMHGLYHFDLLLLSLLMDLVLSIQDATVKESVI